LNRLIVSAESRYEVDAIDGRRGRAGKPMESSENLIRRQKNCRGIMILRVEKFEFTGQQPSFVGSFGPRADPHEAFHQISSTREQDERQRELSDHQ
jgi:hypothetical protein